MGNNKIRRLCTTQGKSVVVRLHYFSQRLSYFSIVFRFRHHHAEGFGCEVSGLKEIRMLLTTDEIRTVFADEIQRLGGKVHEAFDDGDRLFARSVLPSMKEIQR